MIGWSESRNLEQRQKRNATMHAFVREEQEMYLHILDKKRYGYYNREWQSRQKRWYVVYIVTHVDIHVVVSMFRIQEEEEKD